jgi:tetratricopeptide (TPR) repeat protein
VIGGTLMLEHLHPNLDGYFVIADAFYEALRARRMIGAWYAAVPGARARAEIPVTAADSLAGLLRADRLRAGWPFRPAGQEVTPAVDTLRPRTPVERVAQALVLGTAAWPDAMEALRAHYERSGEPAQATRVALALAHEFRYSAQPYMDAARIAVGERRYAEAIPYVRAAVERQESANAVQLLGLLLLRQGEHAAAMPHLQRAVQLAPRNERMQVALRAATALPALERARDAAPRDTAALLELATAYAVTQQFERARATVAALRAVAPASAGARELLRRLPTDDSTAAPRRGD